MAAGGAKHVTTLPGALTRETGGLVATLCEELAASQAKHRIVFSVEAHVGSLVPNPKAALRLLRSVPGLTLTLDYTHFTRAGLPDSAAEPLIAHASHFHARGARKGRLQTSFQQNTIDYARVLHAMHRTDYQGYVGVEYVWVDWEHCNEVDNLSETIQLRDFLRAEAEPGLNMRYAWPMREAAPGRLREIQTHARPTLAGVGRQNAREPGEHGDLP